MCTIVPDNHTSTCTIVLETPTPCVYHTSACAIVLETGKRSGNSANSANSAPLKASALVGFSRYHSTRRYAGSERLQYYSTRTGVIYAGCGRLQYYSTALV